MSITLRFAFCVAVGSLICITASPALAKGPKMQAGASRVMGSPSFSPSGGGGGGGASKLSRVPTAQYKPAQYKPAQYKPAQYKPAIKTLGGNPAVSKLGGIQPLKSGGTSSSLAKLSPGLFGKSKLPTAKINPAISSVLGTGTPVVGIKSPPFKSPPFKSPIAKLPKLPKIPICPPLPCLPKPPFGCKPCPTWYTGWYWYPGFWGGCHGYAGGMCFPTVVTNTVVVELPATVVAGEALPQIVPGTTVALSSTNLGTEQGSVMLEVGSLALPCSIQQWEDQRVALVVPSVALRGATPARLVIMRADGTAARSIDCELVAATVAQP